MEANDRSLDADVIVAGAGPVGLSLAIDLGMRGVRVLLIERQPTPAPWPKMDRSNARTMELYRRIGVADQVRELGYPEDNPMDVMLLRRLDEPALARMPFASVAEKRKDIAASRDGSLPVEPYQLVSQNKLEPFLKEVAVSTPNVTVRYDCELVSFEQDENGVQVTTRASSGVTSSLRASYLAGCDGGSSTVRKGLGIKLEGKPAVRTTTQVVFSADDLYERIVAGKGRHYLFPDRHGSAIIAQGDRKEFTLHTLLPPDVDFRKVIADLIGFDCEFEIRHIAQWRAHLMLADRYRAGRVFIAGDAAHLVIPTGGLGMNTGVGDAFDLSWKLAGTIKGWGGPALLDSYEIERRKVGARNVEAAGWAAEGAAAWRKMVTPELEAAVYADGERGDAARSSIVDAFMDGHSRMHYMVGAEWGYSYAGSPLIATESDDPRTWDINRYVPSARPGVRLPHMWLSDGRAIQDVLGTDYTLLDVEGRASTTALDEALRTVGVTLKVVRLAQPQLRAVYQASVLLLRPDLHVVWRGDVLPPDAQHLARLATGHVSQSTPAPRSAALSSS